MQPILPNLYMLESSTVCNVYLLVTEDGFYLVDSGIHDRARQITQELQAAGYSLSDLQGILLTHGHGDHIGNAGALANASAGEVMGHREDFPFFDKVPPYPARFRLQGWLVNLADRLVFRQPPLAIDVCLNEGDTINAAGTWQVLHTPGHTPGCISFYQPETGTLLCGDALFNLHPATGARGLRLPLPLISVDLQQCRESARKISRLSLNMVCFGHGQPLTGDIQQQILALL